MERKEWDAEDCIHLKACRRMSKRIRCCSCNDVNRGCNSDCIGCAAYVSGGDSFIRTSDAVECARRFISDAFYGYSKDDLMVEVESAMDALSEEF